MTTTPTGLYSLPLYYLREGLAASSAFRAAVGAEDATAARTKVFYVAAPGHTAPGYAIVDAGETLRIRAHGSGVVNEFAAEGELWLTLVLPIDEDDSESDQDLAGYNTVGAIVRDLLDQAGEGGRLNITELLIRPPIRPEEKLRASLGDFLHFSLELTYQGAA